MSKKIKLKNNSSLDPTKIVCFKKQADWWDVRLSNGDVMICNNEEFPWLAKIVGAVVEVQEGLLINLFKITSYTPNGEGYLVGLDGDSPVQLSKEKGDQLMEVCGQLDLAEEILFLQEKGIQSDYKKI